jgi:hypothetical protein
VSHTHIVEIALSRCQSFLRHHNIYDPAESFNILTRDDKCSWASCKSRAVNVHVLLTGQHSMSKFDFHGAIRPACVMRRCVILQVHIAHLNYPAHLHLSTTCTLCTSKPLWWFCVKNRSCVFLFGPLPIRVLDRNVLHVF